MVSVPNTGGLIDEKRNILGVLNIVDVFVLLLALTVVVAGAALAFGGSGPETTTRFVTLDFGSQPESLVSTVNEGDILVQPNNRL